MQNQKLAEKLREYMEREEVSQNELARRVGISASGMSFIMMGKRNPRLETVKNICEVTGLKVEEIW